MTDLAAKTKQKREHFTDEKADYYLKKFQRRLFRQVLQYETLDTHLDSTLKDRGKDLANELGIPANVVAGTEIRDHAEKSCLVGLKVEFELFLYILCHLVLDNTLRHIEAQGRLGNRQKKLA